MKVIIEGTSKEIAALVVAIQERRRLEIRKPLEVPVRALAEILAARGDIETTAQEKLSN